MYGQFILCYKVYSGVASRYRVCVMGVKMCWIREAVKPGLDWGLDWTMDWTVDWTLDWTAWGKGEPLHYARSSSSV